MRDIGKNIKILRTEQNLTQDQLAQLLFVTRQTVSNYENGKSRPDIDMLMKIAEVLGTDINTILYGPAPKPLDKTALIRLAVSGGIALALGIALLVCSDWAQEAARRYYRLSLSVLYGALLQPVFYLFLGYSVAQGFMVILRGKSPQFSAAPYLRRILLVLIVLYLIWAVPFVISSLYEDFQHFRASTAGLEYHSSSLDLPIPIIIRQIANRILHWVVTCPPLPVLFGTGLWLCGFPKSNK